MSAFGKLVVDFLVSAAIFMYSNLQLLWISED